MPLELLIVGAGPTGLTLGCLSLQLGISLRIIDKNSGPSTTSKAIGLQYRVSEVLALIGIVDRFIERGSSPTPVNIYHGNRDGRFFFEISEDHAVALNELTLPFIKNLLVSRSKQPQNGKTKVNWPSKYEEEQKSRRELNSLVNQGLLLFRASAQFLEPAPFI